jgi:cytochrome c biogenesis factor
MWSSCVYMEALLWIHAVMICRFRCIYTIYNPIVGRLAYAMVLLSCFLDHSGTWSDHKLIIMKEHILLWL